MIAGVDEAGRGPLAGPVVAAAVILPEGGIAGMNDSKKLTEKRREALFDTIMAQAFVGVGIAEVAEIDSLNILKATMLAMLRAVQSLPQAPSQMLVDGNRSPARDWPEWRWPTTTIIGGDASEACIGAASIIAKVTRDRMMIAAHARHPEYGWDRNKGYGSAGHMAALAKYGPTPLHRMSFAPVAAARKAMKAAG